MSEGELIKLIDTNNKGEGGGLALCYNDFNLQGTCAESLRHFTTVSSTIYPDLHNHYDAIHEAWHKENPTELQEDDEE